LPVNVKTQKLENSIVQIDVFFTLSEYFAASRVQSYKNLFFHNVPDLFPGLHLIYMPLIEITLAN